MLVLIKIHAIKVLNKTVKKVIVPAATNEIIKIKYPSEKGRNRFHPIFINWS
jgi:hypothetical protein